MSKSGISLTLSGTDGADYVRESLYHDQNVSEAEVIYILADTDITLAHNQYNNVSQNASGQKYRVIGANGADGIADSGDEGVIRYRVDRFMQHAYKWANSADGRPYFPAYSAPFSFNDLTFETGVPVVGSTGSNGQPVTNKSAHYWRGIADVFGEEWHTISVAHDDQAIIPLIKEEFWSSDGKEFHFVVAPKAPTLKVTSTGNAQWYTTPPKAYFVPKVVTQETVILPRSGTVTFTLRSLGGQNVFYRIVSSLSDSTEFTAAGASSVTIADSAFSDGVSYLEYYYAGGITNRRYRTVRKNPTHPSLAESHGNLMWGNATERARIVARARRAPYLTAFNQMKSSDDYRVFNYWDNNGLTPHRWPWFQTTPFWYSPGLGYGGAAINNAFVALVEGWTYTASGKSKSFARYALEKVMGHNAARVDPVGYEANHASGAHPSTEMTGAGYLCSGDLISTAAAYDLIAANFRSDQVADGMTPVEDYYIRDKLAASAYLAMFWNGNFIGINTGMWGTAINVAAIVIALSMPSYSSPLYGVSGYSGSATPEAWTPFPDTPLTWKQVFTDRVAASAYPNLAYRFDPETDDLIRADGSWGGPNLGYYSLMRQTYDTLLNISAIYGLGPWPRAELSASRSIAGTMVGTLGGAGGYYNRALVGNAKFPVLGPASVAQCKARNEEPTMIAGGGGLGIWGIIWYDDELESGGGESTDVAPAITTQPTSQTITEGQSVTFTAAASGSPFPTYQWKKDGSNIAGQTNATLTFIVSPSDAGSYTCVATNSEGSATTNAAVLTVIPLPTPPPLVVTGRSNVRAGISSIIGL